MNKQWFDQGLTYEAFLETDTEEVKANALSRWDTVSMTSEQVNDIKSLEEHSIVAFMELYCPDVQVVLPYIAELTKLNPKLQHIILPRKGYEEELSKIVGHSNPRIPTILVYDHDGELKGMMEEYPAHFKKRLIGLDAEDTAELKRRYRRGYYTPEIIDCLLALLS